MKGFKWLQFSDLHFSVKDTFDTRFAREALLTFLSREKFECDYVFITGDIADKNDYTSARKYVTEILSRIKVDRANVFWAVGNHDIKRGSKLRNSIIYQIRTANDSSMEFEQVMANEEARTLLTYSGMSDYIKEYEQLFNQKLSANEISNAHICYSLKHCNLVVLNTCLTSCDDNDEHNLMITEPKLF